MNFEKSSQLDKVRRYDVNKYGLFALTADLKIPQLPDIDPESLGFRKNGTSIKLCGDFLIVQDTDGRELLYDHKSCKVLYQHLEGNTDCYGLGSGGIGSDRTICFSKTIDGSRKVCILNADSFEFTEFSVPFSVIFGDGEVLLRRELTPPSVSRITREGRELWKHSIEGTYPNVFKNSPEKPNRLSRILGLHGQLLWLADLSKELYALDIDTGVIVFSTFDAGPANKFSLDKKHNRLVSLTSEHLRTVDLSDDKFELSEIEMGEVFKKLDIRPDISGSQFPLVDTHFVFGDKFKSVIGTVRIDNGEVDWVYDLFSTRKYASAANYPTGSLHVFDRVF